MPYVMPVLLGFFDRAGASLGKVQLTEQLDMKLAEQLLREAGERQDDGFVYVGQDRFTLRDGYVMCCDRPHRAGADFIIKFARQTGCDIFHYAVPAVNDADGFAKFFDEVEKIREERLRRSRAERHR